jgi:hypothetical protein
MELSNERNSSVRTSVTHSFNLIKDAKLNEPVEPVAGAHTRARTPDPLCVYPRTQHHHRAIDSTRIPKFIPTERLPFAHNSIARPTDRTAGPAALYCTYYNKVCIMMAVDTTLNFVQQFRIESGLRIYSTCPCYGTVLSFYPQVAHKNNALDPIQYIQVLLLNLTRHKLCTPE